ncbi:MAG: hypothetical protein HOW97_09665 [Catenulispora sp.]|nr:hypothetical protein [Catenulispora sp.]
MATAPTWQAAVAGQPPRAAHVDQLLGPHATTVLYLGTQTDGQTTSAAGTVSTNGTWLAQQITTAAGQTAIGSVSLALTSTTTTGASLAPTTVSLYANAGGAPTGGPLISVTYTAEYAYQASSGGVSTTRIRIPMPVSGLTPSTTYWLVAAAAGTAGNNYVWNKSNQVAGASTSPDGVTWTAQAYGLVYTVNDQTAAGNIRTTWADGGARWAMYTYNASGLVTGYFEYTAGQTAAGYVQSSRTFTYSGNALASIA